MVIYLETRPYKIWRFVEFFIQYVLFFASYILHVTLKVAFQTCFGVLQV
jgi:hypothetical protein